MIDDKYIDKKEDYLNLIKHKNLVMFGYMTEAKDKLIDKIIDKLTNEGYVVQKISLRKSLYLTENNLNFLHMSMIDIYKALQNYQDEMTQRLVNSENFIEKVLIIDDYDILINNIEYENSIKQCVESLVKSSKKTKLYLIIITTNKESLKSTELYDSLEKIVIGPYYNFDSYSITFGQFLISCDGKYKTFTDNDLDLHYQITDD